MRIGIVCEGPTDFHAIEHFFGNSLANAGVEAKFVPIQPEMDNTQPTAGWGNVLLWLQRNLPQYRITNFFGGGLFGGGLSKEPLNCILMQLDTDILGEGSFGNYVSDTYGYVVNVPISAIDRANEIRHILRLAGRFSDMTLVDIQRHVLAPAVESTESWCVAAFEMPTRNVENLSGQTLIDAFMSALETSESRPANVPYVNICKDVERRKRFCKQHSGGGVRVRQGANEFNAVHQELVALS